MAKIPVYTSGISARQGGLGPGPTGSRPIAETGGLGALASGIAEAGQQYLDIKQKKDREDAAAWSAEQLGNARLYWTQQQIDREQNAPAGAKDYTGILTKDFDAYADEQLINAPNDESRNYLRERLSAMKSDIVGRGMQFEARSRLDDRVDKIGKGIDQSRIAVDLDPSQHQSALAENLATLGQLDIPEAAKTKLRDDAIQKISFAAVASRLKSNPGAVMAQLRSEDSGGAVDVRLLNADNRIQLRNAAEAEIKRRETEAKQAAAISRAEMGFRLQDATTAYMQGFQFDNPPSAGELRAAYGPERGQRAFEALSQAQQYGIGVKEYATLPINERAAWLEARAPGDFQSYGKRQDGTEKGSGYFGEMKRPDGGVSTEISIGVEFDGKETEIPTMVPTLTKDELNTLLSLPEGEDIPQGIVDKAVAHARKRIEEGKSPFANSGGGQRIAGEGYAQQSQLFGKLVSDVQGINKQLVDDSAGYAVKYAPEVNAAWQGVMDASDPASAPAAYQAYAEAVKGEQARLGLRQFNVVPKSYAASMAATFKDPANAGPKQIQLIEEMKTNWGKHFPDVFKQVAADLPDSVKIIGSGVDRDTATLLSGISQVKTAELKKPLQSSDVNAMELTLKSSLEPFAKTFAGQYGGAATYGSVYNEAYRGALAQMAQGVSASDAAENMTKRLSANYQIDGTLRVPNKYDIDTVQEGIQAVVSSLKASDIALGEIPGVSVEFTDERTQKLLGAATVIANKDETGVYLMHNGAAILGKNGQPLQFTFEELVGAGAIKPKGKKTDRARMIEQGFR